MKWIVTFYLLLMVNFSGYAQQNPFRRPVQEKADTTIHLQTKPPEKKLKKRNRVWKIIPFSRELLSAQRTLSGKLSSILRTIKAHPRPSTVAVLLLIALLYGVIHSLGPGHAKTLFISHGVSRASSHRSTWIAGAIFSITHTGSAIILFILFRILLRVGQSERDIISQEMITVSGFLIIIAGIIIVISSLLEKKADSAANALLRRSTGLTTVAIIAGLAPCPGAFLILTFSSVIGILPVGIAAVVAVSLGMAVTVSVAGMAGSSIGKSISKKSTHRKWHIVVTVVRYLAAGCIIGIGIVMVV